MLEQFHSYQILWLLFFKKKELLVTRPGERLAFRFVSRVDCLPTESYFSVHIHQYVKKYDSLNVGGGRDRTQKTNSKCKPRIKLKETLLVGTDHPSKYLEATVFCR